MRLRVLLPWRIEVDAPVQRVRAEGMEGAFTLLPRHLDLATTLRQGLLSFVTPEGSEIYVAVDGGTLVKVGPDVLVSTPRAFRGPGLVQLRDEIQERFRQLDERERRARSALDRIGSEVIQRIVELEEALDG